MKVVNLRKEKHDLYIGRGTIWGNPFIIGKDGTRTEVIAKYEKRVRTNSTLLKLIKNLHKNIILGCYCKPLKCHGDVIIKIWKELYNAQ